MSEPGDESAFVKATLVEDETDYGRGWREGRAAQSEMVEEALSTIAGHEQAVSAAEAETLKVELFLKKVMGVVALAGAPEVELASSAVVTTPEMRAALARLHGAAKPFADGAETIETVNEDIVDQMMLATAAGQGKIYLIRLIAGVVERHLGNPDVTPAEIAIAVAETILQSCQEGEHGVG